MSRTTPVPRWAVLLIAGLVGGATVSAETVQSRDLVPGVRLTASSGFAEIEDRYGDRVELELIPGTHLTRIRELADGWVAGGTRPTTDGRELVIVASDPGGLIVIGPPPTDGGRLRFSAVPVVHAGRFAGLAWLEGDDYRQLAVRAAPWDGAAWGEAETVSPPGPGEQVALQAAALTDGSWLLVWTANDGYDDEIAWSRRTSRGWSLPAQVNSDNEVQDVRPALIESAAGAHLGWQWFDGDNYRVKLAFFDGAAWRVQPFLGPPGSIQASLHHGAAGPLVLYRSVIETSWSLLQLAPDGGVRAAGETPGTSRERPLLRWAEDGSLALAWPERGAEGKDLLVIPDWGARR